MGVPKLDENSSPSSAEGASFEATVGDELNTVGAIGQRDGHEQNNQFLNHEFFSQKKSVHQLFSNQRK